MACAEYDVWLSRAFVRQKHCMRQRIDISVSLFMSGSTSIAECSLTCVLCPAWPVHGLSVLFSSSSSSFFFFFFSSSSFFFFSPPATTRGATAAGVRRAWSSEWAGEGGWQSRDAQHALDAVSAPGGFACARFE